MTGTLTILSSTDDITEANDLIKQIEDGIHYLRDINDTSERVKKFFDDFTLPDLKTLRRLVGATDLMQEQVPAARAAVLYSSPLTPRIQAGPGG